MTKLDEIRIKINSIDKEMAELFEKRMLLSANVAEYKKEHALPIYDNNREIANISRNVKYIENEEIQDYYIDFLKNTMSISKKYQSYLLEGAKVAYSGVAGAYAYIAAKKAFPSSKLIAMPTFEEAYRAVENGECDTCVLPIENSYAGDVGNVMDLIFSGTLFINGIIDVEITHNLIAKKGTKIENIKKVISHPQAIAQCNSYILKNNYESLESSNTAVASMMVKESSDDSIAAIASKETAEIYDLEILDSNINDNNNNTTRFAIFSKNLHKDASISSLKKHFIIVFTVKNEAGSLANALNIIGSHSFNMRNLRSRPMKSLLWSYYFYIELDGDISTTNATDMVNELSSVCDHLKIVGTYTTNELK